MRSYALLALTILSYCWLTTSQVQAQNVDYTMRVQQLRWNDNDNGDQAGGRDPRWKIWGTDNAVSGTQGGVCQSQDDIAGAPYTWDVADYNVLNELNTTATSIQVALKGWEDDCGESCDYESGCGFLQEDDDHAPQGNAGAAISFRNDPPCQWNTYGWLDRTSDTRYGVEVGVYWEYVSLNPGAISADQTICEGGDPALLVGDLTESAQVEYQWQYQDNCAGVWTDIAGATLADYDPPAGLLNTRCYRRRVRISCNTGIDAFSNTVTVTVQANSTDPTSINASATTICVGGGPVTLDVIGGSLGTGATWQWYEGGCASGPPIGSGVSIVVNPTTTTSYFVRAEGTCNNSNCATVTITVETLSTDPTGVGTASTNLCAGQTAVLSVLGGSLGTGATWEWYEGSCGGVPAGSGNSISVTPAATTTYFVRAEGSCNTTACASVTINIGNGAADPDSATVTIDNICPEDTTGLVVHSATPLPSGYTYVWYTGACGAVPVGIGDTLLVNPSATTTYFVRAVGTCGASLCASTTVTVLPGSVTPNGALTDNNNFCMGGNANLSVDGGSLEAGANWTWYENSCGGTPIGTGATINVSPTANTTYYVRGEGGSCGNTECVSVTIAVLGVEAILVVPFDTLCVNSTSPFNLTGGFPTGGVYSGTGVSGTVYDPATAGVGTHTVTYTYTDGSGCVAMATQDLVVEPDNVAPASVSATDTVICSATPVTMTVVGGSLVTGANWVWYESACGGTQIGTGTSVAVTPGATITYYVRAEGGACGSSECVPFTITVSDVQAMMIPFDDICGGSAITLDNGFPTGGVYSGAGVSGTTFDPSVAGVGTHTISYAYTDAQGCSDTASADVNVSASTLVASAAVSSEPCAEGGVTITVTASGGSGFYSYSWSDGTSGNPYNYVAPGTYDVSISDGSQCFTTLSGIVVTDDLGCVEVPNSFTPNGDGMNDTWNLDFTAYGTVSLQVFSKWGNLVYETNSQIIAWDGMYNGEELPAGTYYYILKLDSTVDQNGPITIVR